jgi:hypothetical protein
MANSSINLIDLDFNALKTSLKEHMKSQSRFQDYDFDGSNMNVLLDVLTYNSYLNSFYLNMVASEMFLDTAQLRDSVVSHAKELNYLPRSFRSAYANVSIDVTPDTNVTSVVIPAKTSFTARIGSNTFNFSTPSAITIPSSTNGVFTAENVSIYEGSYATDTFVKNDLTSNQRFILNNPNIDTNSIEVSVTENSGTDVYVYTQAFSLFGITSSSKSFFVQAAENEQYEIVFGNNTTGRAPLNGAVISATYRVSSGELPNGADNFTNNSSIDGHANVSVVINQAALGGSISESTQSIKFNAPKNFQAQERAITESDYETLLTREFADIISVAVYGGEKEEPPQYGKVFVAVNLGDNVTSSDSRKKVYNDYLKNRIPIGFTTEIVDPSYVYLDIKSNVKYNTNNTTLSGAQLQSKVFSAIASYSNTYLNDFNSDFRYSNFVTAIDDSDPSILNNDTTVTPYVLVVPTLNQSSSFSSSFNAGLKLTTPTTASHNIDDEAGVYSTPFVYDGIPCKLEDDGNGNMRIVKVTTTQMVEVVKVGTVDYTTGTITIGNFNISSYSGSGIKIYAKTKSVDYTSMLKDVLKVKPEDISVTMIPLQR